MSCAARSGLHSDYVYVVLASVLADDEQARDGMLAGADDYIAKPLRLHQLELKLIAAERVTRLHNQLTRLNDELRRTVMNDAESNRQLTQANRVQADMMAMIGHDARQPLSGVIGYIEATLEEWETIPDDVRRRNLTAAGAAARRVDQLIEDVLMMGNLESGTISVKPEPVLVKRVIEEAIDSASGGVPISVSSDPSACALVDPWHLRQIITNLIANAVKYGTSPITVAVRPAAEAPDGPDRQAMEIVVRDSGEGVPQEFIPHLFERFTRAETGVAARKHGTGFGLYIVRCLVEANHGRISYGTSQPTGACFTVELPGKSETAAPAQPILGASPLAGVR